MRYQMRTTHNFAPGNRLLSWYIGGLNYQIEHHLFPRVCHVHYRQLSPIVQRLAAKHGLPCHSYPTLWQAIRSHYRVLKRLGDPGYQPSAHEHVVWADPVRGWSSLEWAWTEPTSVSGNNDLISRECARRAIGVPAARCFPSLPMY